MADMKSDKMDMSLDDIISLNRKGGRGGGGRAGGGGGGGGRFRRGRGGNRGGGQFQRRRSDDFAGGIARGGVQRRRDGGSAGIPYSRVPDVWKHDLYEDVDRPLSRPVASLPRSSQRDGNRGIAKLIISNLDFGVNDQDIEELFAEFGKLKHFAVHYDKSGRSLGTADVEYERMDEAVKAMKQYNNVPLDGKPMKIEMQGEHTSRPIDSSDRPRSMSSRLGQANHSDNGYSNNSFNSGARRRPDFESRRNQGQGGRSPGQRGGQRGRGRGGRGGRGGRDRESAPSKEDLDAELDAYNAKMETE